jgi:hypothetical protein
VIPRLSSLPLVLALLVSGVGVARGGTATNVTGLYYTGVNSSGGLLAGATQDSHWSVTYADVNGNSTVDNSYEGSAYVVSSAYIDSGWTQNTTTAQWIVPPGARSAATGGTANTGGDFLPGNGNSGANMGIYVYTLAFTITGTGSGTVTNPVSISLTISADDQYSIYVNPTGSGTTLPGGTAAATRTSAWNNSTAATLQNGTNGTNGNAQFVIGTNYLVIRIDNTNSVNGSSGSTTLNPSGLLVYQVGSATLINGVPIPEVGTTLPLLGAVGIYALTAFYRRRSQVAVTTSV